MKEKLILFTSNDIYSDKRKKNGIQHCFHQMFPMFMRYFPWSRSFDVPVSHFFRLKSVNFRKKNLNLLLVFLCVLTELSVYSVVTVYITTIPEFDTIAFQLYYL